jgi:mitogen-activated protein kinase kinase
VGTTGYMAPERIRGDPYTVKADVWSLGVTIVELVSGYFPYSLDSTRRSLIAPRPLEARNDAYGDGDGDGNGNGEDGTIEEDSTLVELWETINMESSPRLDPRFYSSDLVSFVDACFEQNPSRRSSLKDLLAHPFLLIDSKKLDSFRAWVGQMKKNV